MTIDFFLAGVVLIAFNFFLIGWLHRISDEIDKIRKRLDELEKRP